MRMHLTKLGNGFVLSLLLAACASDGGLDLEATETAIGETGGSSATDTHGDTNASADAGTDGKTGAVTGTTTGIATGTSTGAVTGTTTGIATGTSTGAVTGTTTGTTTGSVARDPAVTDPLVYNGFGKGGALAGFWYTVTDNDDGGTSRLSPSCPDPCFANAGRSICIRGEGGAVQDDEYGVCWGAMVGWNVNQPEDFATPDAADLSSYTTLIVGLSCSQVSSPLRVLLDLGDGSHYCTGVTCGTNSLALDDSLMDECWDGGVQTPFDRKLLRAVVGIQIQVTTLPYEPTPFDFCVTQMSLL